MSGPATKSMSDSEISESQERRPSIDFELRISSDEFSSDDENIPLSIRTFKGVTENLRASAVSAPKVEPGSPPASTGSDTWMKTTRRKRKTPQQRTVGSVPLMSSEIGPVKLEPQYPSTSTASMNESPSRKRGRASSMLMTIYSTSRTPPESSVNVSSSEQMRRSAPRNEPPEANPPNVALGSFVSVYGRRELGQIVTNNNPYHVQWYIRSVDTILGTMGDRQELFMTDECGDIEQLEVKDIVEVYQLSQKARYDPASLEFINVKKYYLGKSRKAFFYQKKYIRKFGRFEDITADDYDQTESPCCNCARRKKQEQREATIPIGEIKFDENTRQYVVDELRYRDEVIRCGSDIFLTPGTLHQPPQTVHRPDEGKYDDTLYPEKYRKQLDAEEEQVVPQPFDVGRVFKIFSETRNFDKNTTYVRVRKYYRPHNTCLPTAQANREELNFLYWSDEECVVSFTEVVAKCYVANAKYLDVDNIFVWTNKGPYRFHMEEKYNRQQGTFTQLSESNEHDISGGSRDPPVNWPSVERPMAAMDIYCGAGGLTVGLQQSGVARVKWAVECNTSAATSYRLNSPHTTVFQRKCEDLLKDIQQGSGPCSRGEVELICSGPPNFDRTTRSSIKDSPIGIVCSYVEYFRPRYVIIESGKKLLHADEGKVLRITLMRLLDAGYQVTFGLLQCGMYGVPQSRRRMVILAAAPGENVPKFPEPIVAFVNNLLTVRVCGKEMAMDLKWTSSGPYRAMTVADAISDLPPIAQGEENKEVKLYGSEPTTHYQRMVRHSSLRELRDHITYKTSVLDYERLCRIPAGGDWRDLVNWEIVLPNGARIPKLHYTHHDWKNGASSTGEFRGVCSCAERRGAPCKRQRRQPDTLIPWCLPHTANRHHQWRGLFGRIAWEGFFNTISPNMELMGRTGRTVHPTEHRVVSVRECARAQAFPDSARFSGTLREKYEQVGNACPPPLAYAIGRSLLMSSNRH